MVNLYETVGYDCRQVSAVTGEGIDALTALLKDKVTLLSGNSGVGKSSLLNRFIPDADARVAEISDAHDTGVHTTTFSEMMALPQGGYVIDTPGVKGFGTFDMRPEEIGSYFKEIFRFSKDCRFNNCTHTHEPGCAVRRAAEEDRLLRIEPRGEIERDDALELAKKNEELTLGEGRMTEGGRRFGYVEADVFHYLRKCRDEGRTFDLVVLDPPKFAATKSQVEKAARGYKDINLLAMKLLKPNGILATFSCSGAMTSELFDKVLAEAAVDAHRDFQMIGRTRQGADHPVALTK